ncbi:hypothetical protein RF11_12569 [Thelohanellus kitauei]|uniref:Uncharacterized protein n=1 Tax=Thelohanellus kitauei TaxID=669202 RepID=A0A0C2N514_THEKT|nr:hypothetical protein RF11_12569 [Thelohanellus kitauei]
MAYKNTKLFQLECLVCSGVVTFQYRIRLIPSAEVILDDTLNQLKKLFSVSGIPLPCPAVSFHLENIFTMGFRKNYRIMNYTSIYLYLKEIFLYSRRIMQY